MKHVHAELLDACKHALTWFEAAGFSDLPVMLHLKEAVASESRSRTIKVNGFDVPEPISDPQTGATYWAADPTQVKFAFLFTFNGGWEWRDAFRDRGLLHSTKEAAIKHAMAMCGIDPATYKEEE